MGSAPRHAGFEEHRRPALERIGVGSGRASIVGSAEASGRTRMGDARFIAAIGPDGQTNARG